MTTYEGPLDAARLITARTAEMLTPADAALAHRVDVTYPLTVGKDGVPVLTAVVTGSRGNEVLWEAKRQYHGRDPVMGLLRDLVAPVRSAHVHTGGGPFYPECPVCQPGGIPARR